MRALDRLTVWVVDDDSLFCEVAFTQLQQLGVGQIRQMNAAMDVLELLGSGERVDILICDLRMPDMDGVELLRNVANRYPGLGIIIVSELDDRLRFSVSRLTEAHPLRLLGAIGKPVTREALAALLEKFDPDSPQHGSTPGPKPITAEDIRTGLANHEFCMHVQPVVSVAGEEIHCGELLVRWQHPERGLLAPGFFLSVAEKNGLMDELLFATLDPALAAWRKWRKVSAKSGHADIPLAINVSVQSLTELSLPDRLTGMLQAHELSPGDMFIEVTESEFIHDLRRSLDVLNRLRLNGVELVIDDFGTGFSSLQQLHNVPFSKLKIDRSFVSSAMDYPNSLAIVQSSIELAHRLGLKTVAEGIEEAAQQELVAGLGCDYVQGYFIARPMPLEDFPDWCTERLSR